MYELQPIRQQQLGVRPYCSHEAGTQPDNTLRGVMMGSLRECLNGPSCQMINVPSRRGLLKVCGGPRWASARRRGVAHYAIHQLGRLKPGSLGYFDEVEHVDLALGGLDAPHEIVGPLQFRCKFPLTQARRFARLDNRCNQCAMSRAA